jgi:hypothetical protein
LKEALEMSVKVHGSDNLTFWQKAMSTGIAKKYQASYKEIEVEIDGKIVKKPDWDTACYGYFLDQIKSLDTKYGLNGALVKAILPHLARKENGEKYKFGEYDDFFSNNENIIELDADLGLERKKEGIILLM